MIRRDVDNLSYLPVYPLLYNSYFFSRISSIDSLTYERLKKTIVRGLNIT